MKSSLLAFAASVLLAAVAGAEESASKKNPPAVEPWAAPMPAAVQAQSQRKNALQLEASCLSDSGQRYSSQDVEFEKCVQEKTGRETDRDVQNRLRVQ